MTTVNVEVIGCWGNRLTVLVDIQDTDAGNRRSVIEYSYNGSESSKHELSDKQIKRLTKALDALSIPAVPEFVMGLDGHRVNLSIEQGFNSASYSWWVECPAGWEELGSLVKTVLGLVPSERALARMRSIATGELFP